MEVVSENFSDLQLLPQKKFFKIKINIIRPTINMSQERLNQLLILSIENDVTVIWINNFIINFALQKVRKIIFQIKHYISNCIKLILESEKFQLTTYFFHFC